MHVWGLVARHLAPCMEAALTKRNDQPTFRNVFLRTSHVMVGSLVVTTGFAPREYSDIHCGLAIHAQVET